MRLAEQSSTPNWSLYVQRPHGDAQKSEQRRSRRASYLMVFVVSLVVLVGFTALAVDLGTLRLANTQLQIAVDASALAGSSQLDGTTEGVERARASALAVAQMNKVRGAEVSLDVTDLEFGVWTGGVLVASADPHEIDAVRVTGLISDVPTPFAGFSFAQGTADVTATSIGQRPPPEPAAWSQCFLPVLPAVQRRQRQRGLGPPRRRQRQHGGRRAHGSGHGRV
jgi:Flp pilus assembly protein TadG